ncbi:MAG: hypothetical protein AB1589_19280 [Cyanobacteriota bacterium]
MTLNVGKVVIGKIELAWQKPFSFFLVLQKGCCCTSIDIATGKQDIDIAT